MQLLLLRLWQVKWTFDGQAVRLVSWFGWIAGGVAVRGLARQ